MKTKIWLATILFTATLFITSNVLAEKTLLNVSYDPTHELYQEFNVAFAKYWQAKKMKKSRFNNRTVAQENKPDRS